MRYMSVIPARGRSKGIPGKNIRMLAGKPLIGWSISQSLATAAIDRTIVSTDDAEIAAVARAHGAEVPFLRPAELATDEAPTEPTLIHAVRALAETGYRPDAIVLLQPTSPLRSRSLIASAIQAFEASSADSLLTVAPSHSFFWRPPTEAGAEPQALYDYRNRPRRQDIRPENRVVRETGSVYISRTDALLESGNRLSGRIVLHEASEAEGLEIDSLVDFAIVEKLITELGFR